MNSFEKLEQEIYDKGISLDFIHFDSPRIKGLYMDGSIALSTELQTTAEKTCVAVEELAHHELNHGNILDLNITANRKQERLARLSAFNRKIGLLGIINAYKAKCVNAYEMAEYLEVTETFLVEALKDYRQIYGEGISMGDYYISFEPNLQVYEYFTL